MDVHKKGALSPTLFETIISRKDNDTTYESIEQKDLYDGEECYIRLHSDNNDSPMSSILQKISIGNEVLGKIAEVNAGIMGGCDSITKHNLEYVEEEYTKMNDLRKGDGVFVLDRENIRDNDQISNIGSMSFCKDFYKNSDIRKYYTSTSTSKMIIFSSSDTPVNDQTIIKSCLEKYKPILVKIREINNEKIEYWYQLRRGTAHPHIFTCNKIVCPQRSKYNTFGYNECDWYASADVYYITNPSKDYHIKYLLGLLNSKLLYFWLYNKGKRKGESLELYQKPLSEIPVAKVGMKDQIEVVSFVDKIIKPSPATTEKDIKDYISEIDTIIYNLYGLNDKEIDYIEDFYRSKL